MGSGPGSRGPRACREEQPRPGTRWCVHQVRCRLRRFRSADPSTAGSGAIGASPGKAFPANRASRRPRSSPLGAGRADRSSWPAKVGRHAPRSWLNP